MDKFIWIIVAIIIIIIIIVAYILLTMNKSNDTPGSETNNGTTGESNNGTTGGTNGGTTGGTNGGTTSEPDNNRIYDGMVMPLPVVKGVKTSLASVGGSYINPNNNCLNAKDSNAVGWILRNNYIKDVRPQITRAYGESDCQGNREKWGNIVVKPGNIVRWDDYQDDNGAYFTFYNNCRFVVGIDDVVDTFSIRRIDVQNQYVFIDVDSKGNVSVRFVNNGGDVKGEIDDIDMYITLPPDVNSNGSLAENNGSLKTAYNNCVNVADNKGVGWVLRNRYTEDAEPQIANAYPMENCSGDEMDWGNVVVKAGTTDSWDDYPDPSNSYLTFYQGCRVSVSINGNVYAAFYLRNINPKNQYVLIDIDSNGNVTNRIVKV